MSLHEVNIGLNDIAIVYSVPQTTKSAVVSTKQIPMWQIIVEGSINALQNWDILVLIMDCHLKAVLAQLYEQSASHVSRYPT